MVDNDMTGDGPRSAAEARAMLHPEAAAAAHRAALAAPPLPPEAIAVLVATGLVSYLDRQAAE